MSADSISSIRFDPYVLSAVLYDMILPSYKIVLEVYHKVDPHDNLINPRELESGLWNEMHL
jgi:hypothetical protein